MLERLLLRAVVQHTKPLCNKTELNRNSKTEMRWNKIIIIIIIEIVLQAHKHNMSLCHFLGK